MLQWGSQTCRFFRFKDNRGLTRVKATRGALTSHSFQSRAATMAAQNGMQELLIKTWATRSAAYTIYIRTSPEVM